MGDAIVQIGGAALRVRTTANVEVETQRAAVLPDVDVEVIFWASLVGVKTE